MSHTRGNLAAQLRQSPFLKAQCYEARRSTLALAPGLALAGNVLAVRRPVIHHRIFGLCLQWCRAFSKIPRSFPLLNRGCEIQTREPRTPSQPQVPHTLPNMFESMRRRH